MWQGRQPTTAHSSHVSWRPPSQIVALDHTSVYRLFAQRKLDAVRFSLDGSDQHQWHSAIDEAKKYAIGSREDCGEHDDEPPARSNEEQSTPRGTIGDGGGYWNTTCPADLEPHVSYYPAKDIERLAADWPFDYEWTAPVLSDVFFKPNGSDISTQPDRHFTLFPRLPAKLRRLIYLESVEPQVVWLRRISTTDPGNWSFLRTVNKTLMPRDPNRIRQWSDLPLLRVCYQSRRVMLELFGSPQHRVWGTYGATMAEIASHMPMSVPFNPILDSVRISFNHFSGYPQAVLDHWDSKVFPYRETTHRLLRLQERHGPDAA
ncbi:hypothetical protein OQA88_7660 [Cercophora sp. LCS_1]